MGVRVGGIWWFFGNGWSVLQVGCGVFDDLCCEWYGSGEVEYGLCYFVDVVGLGVQCDVLDDFDDLGIVVVGSVYGCYFGISDVVVLSGYVGGEVYGGVCFGVVGVVIVVGGDFYVVQFGEFVGYKVVGCQVVVVGVDLGYGQCDVFMCLGW